MSVSVTFNGATYLIPEDDELGWADLTNYLVALAAAQVSTTNVQAYRVATATPVAVSASADYAVGVNVASAATVTLPSGTNGQVFVIYDASGAGATNQITISGTSGQKINGRTSYVIRSNFGAVQVQFVLTEWKVLSERQTVGDQNTTNLSVVDATVAADNSGVSVTNLQSCTVTFAGSFAQFCIHAGDKAMSCSCDKNSNNINCMSDPDAMLLVADAGTGIVVTKSANTITIKNRLGTSAVFRIKFISGSVTAATVWS